jgi:dihydroxyacetone kinase-like protein
MEQFIIMRGVGKVLAKKGVVLARARVGEFLTVQEMGGFQMFVAKMDDELLKYWDAPCDTPYLTVR